MVTCEARNNDGISNETIDLASDKRKARKRGDVTECKRLRNEVGLQRLNSYRDKYRHDINWSIILWDSSSLDSGEQTECSRSTNS